MGRLLPSTLVPPSLRAAHERGFERYLQTGEGPVIDQVIEVPALHRDGREFPIQLAITPAARSGPRALTVAFAKDLEREKSRQRAREAKVAVAHPLEGSSSFTEAAPDSAGSPAHSGSRRVISTRFAARTSGRRRASSA